MQKWNINFNRILKVASCSVVIFTLLLASLVMPSRAAVAIQAFKLTDYMAGNPSVSNNGFVTLRYYFDTPRYITAYDSGIILYEGIRKHDEYVSIVPTQLDQFNWHEWPFGTKIKSGEVVTDGVLDISEFKQHSTLKLTLDANVYLSYSYFSEAQGDSQLDILANYYVYFYDGNGKPVGTFISKANYTERLQELESGRTAYLSDTIYYGGLEITIPDNAVYMALCLQANVTLPGHYAGIQLHEFSLNTDYLTLEAQYNSILEDSETFKAIENQLDDLNDKADTIINGTDEQWGQAQDRDEAMQDVENSLEDQLDRLDELEDFDTSTVFGTINEFLEADGWKDIRMLLAPLLDWTHAATLMLFVFAFSTLRILLLGR